MPLEEDYKYASEMTEGQEVILIHEDSCSEKNDFVDKPKVEPKKKKKKKRKKQCSCKTEKIEFVEQVQVQAGIQDPPSTSGTSTVVLRESSKLIECENMKAGRIIEYSRRLLEIALCPYNLDNVDINDDDREKLTFAAFQHAAAARRLHDGEDREDIETVISDNASKGEAAAAKARRILAMQNELPATPNVKGADCNIPMKDGGWSSRYTPQEILDDAGVHALKARHHLEAILPVFECTPEEHTMIQPQPFFPTTGIVTDGQDNQTFSTLGFDNTFQETILSITSLNEFLDGPLSPTETKVEIEMSKDLTDRDLENSGDLENSRKGRGLKSMLAKSAKVLDPFKLRARKSKYLESESSRKVPSAPLS